MFSSRVFHEHILHMKYINAEYVKNQCWICQKPLPVCLLWLWNCNSVVYDRDVAWLRDVTCIKYLYWTTHEHNTEWVSEDLEICDDMHKMQLCAWAEAVSLNSLFVKQGVVPLMDSGAPR